MAKMRENDPSELVNYVFLSPSSISSRTEVLLVNQMTLFSYMKINKGVDLSSAEFLN